MASSHEDEMQSHKDNDTFIITSPPECKKIITGRWVYTVRYDANRQERFKARFIARGYCQNSCRTQINIESRGC